MTRLFFFPPYSSFISFFCLPSAFSLRGLTSFLCVSLCIACRSPHVFSPLPSARTSSCSTFLFFLSLFVTFVLIYSLIFWIDERTSKYRRRHPHPPSHLNTYAAQCWSYSQDACARMAREEGCEICGEASSSHHWPKRHHPEGNLERKGERENMITGNSIRALRFYVSTYLPYQQITATTICGSDLHLYTGAMVFYSSLSSFFGKLNSSPLTVEYERWRCFGAWVFGNCWWRGFRGEEYQERYESSFLWRPFPLFSHSIRPFLSSLFSY